MLLCLPECIGPSIAFKSVDSVPMLSHLPENAAASRSLDECLAKWQSHQRMKRALRAIANGS